MIPNMLRTAILRGGLGVPLVLLLAGAVHGDAPEKKQRGASTRYLILELPGIDGAESAGSSINNLGIVTGWSSVPDEGTRHATLWFHGLKLDLGTHGGPNSTIIWPQSNPGGMVVGFAETEEMDENEEDWSCSAFFPGDPTHHICRGFAWQWGRMKEMPPLEGGTHSVAVGANAHGEVVGWAETGFEDPTCGPDRNQQLQFLPVVWKPRTGEIRSLPPFGECPDGPCSTGTANAINNNGQIVGISGECDQAVGRASARYIVMWEDGVPKDLGNIGGDHWNTPTAINDEGQVVGFANVEPGPGFGGEHGFLWTEEVGIQDLGTLDGDVRSQAWGINEHGQVVGLSIGADGLSAVLWEDGEIIDLNERVAFGYDKRLAFANDINDLGIITGGAVDPDTGEDVAFWAIPLPGHRGAGGN